MLGEFEIRMSFDLDELKRLERRDAIQEVRSWIELAVSEVFLKLDDNGEDEIYSGN